MSLAPSYARPPAELHAHLAELDAHGVTVVPPATAGTEALVEPLREQVLRVAKERRARDGSGPAGRQLFYLLDEHPIFQEAMLCPGILALARHLIPDAVISSVTASLKEPGTVPALLHADQPIHPVGPSLVCNTTLLLSDYDRGRGALCVVPGSHRVMRQPLDAENFRVPGLVQAEVVHRLRTGEDLSKLPFRDPPHAVPIEAPAGSVVAWHGNTWHGAFPRREAGLRMSLVLFWCSPWLRPQEAYRESLDDAVLERHGEDFARLVGRDVSFGWTREGPELGPGAAFRTQRSRIRK